MNETAKFNNLYTFSYFLNQAPDNYDNSMQEDTIPTVELVDDVDDYEDDHTGVNLPHRVTSSYGIEKLFDDKQRFKLYSKPPIRPATRDSIAHSLEILAKSTSIEFSTLRKIQDMPYNLTSVAVEICAIPNSLIAEMNIGRKLCSLALLCVVYNRIIAFDIYLIAADYYYFVLKLPTEAAQTLERAVSAIKNDPKRIVPILQQTSKLYEEANLYHCAIQIERQIEKFDLTVDWIDNCKQRQRYLLAKFQSEE